MSYIVNDKNSNLQSLEVKGYLSDKVIEIVLQTGTSNGRDKI